MSLLVAGRFLKRRIFYDGRSDRLDVVSVTFIAVFFCEDGHFVIQMTGHKGKQQPE